MSTTTSLKIFLFWAILALTPLRLAHADTFTVNLNDDTDNGSCAPDKCSLRDAINAANNKGGGDIVFDSRLSGATIKLTSNLPALVEPINITGPGRDKLTIDGDGVAEVIFIVNKNAKVPADFKISGLKMKGAKETAVLLVSNNTLTLSSCEISENGRQGIQHIGAGIHTLYGTLVVADTIFTDNGNGTNTAIIYFTSKTDGSIRMDHVVMDESNGKKNQSSNSNISVTTQGDMTLENSTISHGVGGGILISSAGKVIIDHTTIQGNSGTLAGGLYFGNITTSVTITDSWIDQNISSNLGGGIFNTSASAPLFKLINTTVSNNSTLVNGGGIYTQKSMDLVNSTISGNKADVQCGGVYIDGQGRYNVFQTTITNNKASGIGGGICITNKADIDVSLKNTLIAGNTDSNNDFPDCGSQGSNLQSRSHNLIANMKGCILKKGEGDLLGNFDSAPELNPSKILDTTLSDNGSPTTPTHALVPGSIAIDAGADCEPTDQRGVARPQGAGCDIGAYEASAGISFTATGLNFAILSMPDTKIKETSSVVLTVTSSGIHPLDIQSADLTQKTVFSIKDDSCKGKSLKPGETCIITLAFSPTDKGPAQDTLTLTSNAPTSPNIMGLKANGLAGTGVDPNTGQIPGGGGCSIGTNNSAPFVNSVFILLLTYGAMKFIHRRWRA